jgi:hypothetical protein
LLGRVRVPSVPRRLRSYWALRLLAFFGRRCGLPRCAAHLGSGAFLYRPWLHPRPMARRRFLDRLSVQPELPEEGRDSPRLLGRPLGTCRGLRPRRARPHLALLSVLALLPSRHLILWALGKPRFGAVLTRPASLSAYVSSEDIAVLGARLTTGPPGSALAGQALHLPDDASEFPDYRIVSVPSDQSCLVTPSAVVHRGGGWVPGAGRSTPGGRWAGARLRLAAVGWSGPGDR